MESKTQKLIKCTFKLYAEAIGDAKARIVRQWYLPLTGLIVFLIYDFISTRLVEVLYPSNFRLSGFLYGLLQSIFFSITLTLVSILWDYRKFGLPDIRHRTALIFPPVLAVNFVFWVLSFMLFPALLARGNPAIYSVLYLALFITFNPLQEVIIREGTSRSYFNWNSLLADCLDFIRGNWPEWLIAAVLLLGPFMLVIDPEFVVGFVLSANPLILLFSLAKFSIMIDLLDMPIFHLFYLQIILKYLFIIYYFFFVSLIRLSLFFRLSTSNRRKRLYQYEYAPTT